MVVLAIRQTDFPEKSVPLVCPSSWKRVEIFYSSDNKVSRCYENETAMKDLNKYLGNSTFALEEKRKSKLYQLFSL